MAQKLVGPAQLVKLLAAHVTLVVQLLQGEQSAARAQPGLLAAIDALQTLHQKLDVPDTAGVQLEVDARAGRLESPQPAAAGVHFIARQQRGLDGGKIHLLGIHMGLDGASESPA